MRAELPAQVKTAEDPNSRIVLGPHEPIFPQVGDLQHRQEHTRASNCAQTGLQMSSLPRVCLCWTTCAADELELLGFIALKRSAAVRRCQLTPPARAGSALFAGLAEALKPSFWIHRYLAPYKIASTSTRSTPSRAPSSSRPGPKTAARAVIEALREQKAESLQGHSRSLR